MRILFVGGSGYVGSLILPELLRHHSVRVLDLRPPAADCDYVPGDATDPDAMSPAMSDVDAVLHAAMSRISDWPGSVPDAMGSFDVNVKSVYVTLRLAHEAGVPHAVYISSMSVYRNLQGRDLVTEQVPPDAGDPYGLTKRLGEQVCRAAAAEWGMSVNVLRLAWPTPDETWPTWSYPPNGSQSMQTDRGEPLPALAGSDLARAVLAALEHRNGYDLFSVAGDHDGHLIDLRKARDVLGWEPEFRLPG